MSTVRLGGRTRRWPLVLVGAAVALFILLSALSGFVIDLWWFEEIGQRSVFWRTLWSKVLLGAVFGLVFALLLYVNLVIARRLRPTTRVLTPDQEALDRIRDLSDPFLRWLIPLGAALLGLLVGIGVAGEWQTFLLWRNSSGITFGNPDPLFGKDPAFYIFTMPWLRFLQGWLFSAFVGVTILVAIAHVLWGGIRPAAPAFADKVTPAARAHLSVLLGLIMLVKAWGYWLGRYDLLTSRRGVVEGASYTDVHAQLPALNLLVIVAVICAVLFFLNIRLRQWSLPLIAVGLLVLASVLLGTAYPAFIQRFRVEPNEQGFEQEYIEDNISATRTAFGLDAFDAEQRNVGGPLTAAQLAENAPTVANIRLWRGKPIMLENFQSLERFRQYYDFFDVDVDRYVIDGERRVLQVAPREIAQSRPRPVGADLAERPPGVHAWIRRRRRPGERGDHGGSAGVHAREPAAGRRTRDDPAARLLRRGRRCSLRRRRDHHGRARFLRAHRRACRMRARGGIQLVQPLHAGPLRVAVPRLQPPGVEQHHRREPHPDPPGHRVAGAQAGSVPAASTTTRTSPSSRASRCGSGMPTPPPTNTRTRRRSMWRRRPAGSSPGTRTTCATR